jgi:hypothetical protein
MNYYLLEVLIRERMEEVQRLSRLAWMFDAARANIDNSMVGLATSKIGAASSNTPGGFVLWKLRSTKSLGSPGPFDTSPQSADSTGDRSMHQALVGSCSSLRC